MPTKADENVAKYSDNDLLGFTYLLNKVNDQKKHTNDICIGFYRFLWAGKYFVIMTLFYKFIYRLRRYIDIINVKDECLVYTAFLMRWGRVREILLLGYGKEGSDGSSGHSANQRIYDHTWHGYLYEQDVFAMRGMFSCLLLCLWQRMHCVWRSLSPLGDLTANAIATVCWHGSGSRPRSVTNCCSFSMGMSRPLYDSWLTGPITLGADR